MYVALIDLAAPEDTLELVRSAVLGRLVQIDGLQTRVESDHGLSA